MHRLDATFIAALMIVAPFALIALVCIIGGSKQADPKADPEMEE